MTIAESLDRSWISDSRKGFLVVCFALGEGTRRALLVNKAVRLLKTRKSDTRAFGPPIDESLPASRSERREWPLSANSRFLVGRRGELIGMTGWLAPVAASAKKIGQSSFEEVRRAVRHTFW